MTRALKSRHRISGFIDPEKPMDIVYRHERHSVGECPWCDFIRTDNIVKDFQRRIDSCGVRVKSLNMWSLGTSLKDTPYNRKILMRWWRIFHDRIKRNRSWVPLFRVRETGRRGFLHFHVIVADYVKHDVILRIWRSITGEASNVHVSGSPPNRNHGSLIRYLVKYLTKQSSAYRWMGPLYGHGDCSRGITSRKGRTGLQYAGETCYELITRGYVEPIPPQRKIIKETSPSQ